MIHAARALGLHVMLGCMVESQLGVAPRRGDRVARRLGRPRRPPAARRPAVHRPPVRGRPRAAERRAGPRGGARVSRLAIFAEGLFAKHTGKTAHGVIRYGTREVVAVIDSTCAGRTAERGRAVLREAGADRGEPRGGARARTGHAADRRRPARREARPRLEERPARGHRGGALARGGPPHAAERRARAERGRGANRRRAPRPPQGAARPHRAEGPVQPPRLRDGRAQRGLRHGDREEGRDARAGHGRARARAAARCTCPPARPAWRSPAGASPWTT